MPLSELPHRAPLRAPSGLPWGSPQGSSGEALEEEFEEMTNFCEFSLKLANFTKFRSFS